MKLLSLTRRVAAPLALALTFLGAQAVEPTQANRKYANYYYAYPYPENPLPQLTAAPKGYEPFHIEHYGRHGSRWHIGSWVYRQPIDLLRPAERNGKLTPRGVELMKQLRKTEKQSRGRSGELTPLGARQHRGIAERMTRNFPEVFKGDANVDAKSTVVIRCVLSMENELRALQAFNPDLNITSDASGATMFYMNNENDSITNAKVSSEAAKRLSRNIRKIIRRTTVSSISSSPTRSSRRTASRYLNSVRPFCASQTIRRASRNPLRHGISSARMRSRKMPCAATLHGSSATEIPI